MGDILRKLEVYAVACDNRAGQLERSGGTVAGKARGRLEPTPEVLRQRAAAARKGLFLVRPTEEGRDIHFTTNEDTMTLLQAARRAGLVTDIVPA